MHSFSPVNTLWFVLVILKCGCLKHWFLFPFTERAEGSHTTSKNQSDLWSFQWKEEEFKSQIELGSNARTNYIIFLSLAINTLPAVLLAKNELEDRFICLTHL